MRSRFQLLITIVFAFYFIGCDAYLHDKKMAPEVLELKSTKFDCLKAVPEDLKAFSTGAGEEKKISASIGCVQTALQYFSERTKGSRENGYTAEDLRSFFGKYLLKENNVTPEFAQSLYKLKVAFFGGDQEVMTREELARLISVLEVFKTQSVALAPHMKILVFQAKGKVNLDEVTAAAEQLRKSLQVLLRVVDLSRSDYSFESLKVLMSGLSQFIQGSGQVGLYSDIRSWVPLVEAVKNVFIGQKTSINGISDWSDVVNNMVDLYGVTIRIYYFGNSVNFSNPSDVKRATQLGNQLLTMVENSYQMKRTAAIPLEDLDNLIDQMVEMKLLTFISKKAIKDTYKILLSGMFDPVRRGETRGLVDFNREHLATIRREFNIYLLGQNFVDSLPFDEKGYADRKRILAAYQQFDLRKAISESFHLENIEASAMKAAWEDLGLLLNQPRQIQFDMENRILVQAQGDLYPYTWKSMTWWNLLRTFARLFQLGYGNRDSLNIAQSEISEAMFAKWYDDFNTLGVEIKAFDPRGANGGKRSFKEANFFMYSSDGTGGVSYRESFEFVSFLFSAGFKNVSDIKTMAEKFGCANEAGELDVFGNLRLNEKCLKDALKRNFSRVFPNLPGMAADVRKMSAKSWDYFYANLMAASRGSDPRTGTVETGDIRTMTMILHYVESLIVTFDVNQSDTLDVAEVKLAAPRFRDFAKPSVHPEFLQPWDGFVDDCFANMVVNGAKPDFWAVLKFQAQKALDREATRTSMLRVFSTLKEALKTPSK